MKAGYNDRRPLNDDYIDEQQEQPEGKDGDGYGEDD